MAALCGPLVTKSLRQTLDKVDLRVVRAIAIVESDLVLDSDYSVTLNADQETSPGGTITYPIVGSPLALEVLV